MSRTDKIRAVAQHFHDTYEDLAPDFGYVTNPRTSVPWDDLPADNKNLMVATVGHVCTPMLEDLMEQRERIDTLREHVATLTDQLADLLAEVERLRAALDTEKEANATGWRMVEAKTAEVERVRAERNVYARHSVTCNSIAWRIAEIVGDVPDGVDQVLDDPFGRLDRLEAELERLRGLVNRAIGAFEQTKDDIAGWGAYASDYFQEKHDLAGDIARIERFITVLHAAPTEGGES